MKFKPLRDGECMIDIHGGPLDGLKTRWKKCWEVWHYCFGAPEYGISCDMEKGTHIADYFHVYVAVAHSGENGFRLEYEGLRHWRDMPKGKTARIYDEVTRMR